MRAALTKPHGHQAGYASMVVLPRPPVIITHSPAYPALSRSRVSCATYSHLVIEVGPEQLSNGGLNTPSTVAIQHKRRAFFENLHNHFESVELKQPQPSFSTVGSQWDEEGEAEAGGEATGAAVVGGGEDTGEGDTVVEDTVVEDTVMGGTVVEEDTMVEEDTVERDTVEGDTVEAHR